MYYGKHYKIGGLVCGYVARSGAHGQEYHVIYEREYAAIEQIEAIDWGHITVECLDDRPCPLSGEYAYELVGIDYNSSCKYYTVTVRMARQLLGDVTGYQAEVDTLQETVAEQAAEVQRAGEALEAKTAEVEAKAVQVIGLTNAVTQVAAISTELPDDLALTVQSAAPNAFPRWEDVLEAAQELPAGRIIDDGGQLYHVEQAVVPQAHQPPHAEGMLAIYRPIVPSHAGTADDPIPWVYGMDCSTGLYYSYEGSKYRCAGDMKPCVWAPDTPGLWQWTKVE